jgi:hypothetical protein
MHNNAIELKDVLTLVISAVAVIVGFITLIKGLIEFRKSTITKRLELFLSMRSRLREDSNFIEICELLERDDPKLRVIPLVQKDRFTGFFEELAIMRNSGLMTDELALYMFGYYAILCNKSENYWYGLNKKQVLWSLFFDFASDMERRRDSYRYDRKRLNLK